MAHLTLADPTIRAGIPQALNLREYQRNAIQGQYAQGTPMTAENYPMLPQQAGLAGHYLAPNTITPQADQFQVVNLLRETTGAGVGGDPRIMANSQVVTDWSLKNIDRQLLREHRRIQALESPFVVMKKKFAEMYGIRNKYIQKMEETKATLMKELLLPADEAYHKAWNEVIKPQFQHDMSLVNAKYPDLEAITRRAYGRVGGDGGGGDDGRGVGGFEFAEME